MISSDFARGTLLNVVESRLFSIDSISDVVIND